MDDAAWYPGDQSVHQFHHSAAKASFHLAHRVHELVNVLVYHEVDDDEAMAPALIEEKELADYVEREPVVGKDLVEENELGVEIERTALIVAVQKSLEVPSHLAEKVPEVVLVLSQVDRILVR